MSTEVAPAKRCQLKSALVVNVADFYKEPQLDNSLTTVQSPEYQAQMGEGCLKKGKKSYENIFAANRIVYS